MGNEVSTVAGSMGDVITALTTSLNADAFFGVVADLVPFIVIMVPVALGITFFRKMTKGAGNGKVRI